MQANYYGLPIWADAFNSGLIDKMRELLGRELHIVRLRIGGLLANEVAVVEFDALTLPDDSGFQPITEIFIRAENILNLNSVMRSWCQGWVQCSDAARRSGLEVTGFYQRVSDGQPNQAQVIEIIQQPVVRYTVFLDNEQIGGELTISVKEFKETFPIHLAGCQEEEPPDPAGRLANCYYCGREFYDNSVVDFDKLAVGMPGETRQTYRPWCGCADKGASQ